MKNSICFQKNNILNCIAYLISILFLISSNTALSQIQYIRNGSFEIHADTTYPHDLTPNNMPGGPGYPYSQLQKCIGFCYHLYPYAWPPTQPTQGGCAYHSLDAGGGWYWPSSSGSSDYYHINGTDRAHVPNVSPCFDNLLHPIVEKRFPYGYLENESNHDSAYIGIRIMPDKSDISKGFASYKEYVQSKLINPLAQGVYVVKFYVSRSQYSRSIRKIGALFTSYGPITPDQFHDKDHWEMNLKDNSVPYPYKYYDSPQVCSKELLDQKADINGYGGWQAVCDTLVVPADSIYNYITLGNFQNDDDLYADIQPEKKENDNAQIYYFIDNITIENLYPDKCLCLSWLVQFNVNKQLNNSDSLHCCYDYSLHFPVPNFTPTAPMCGYTRYVIKKGTTTLKDTSAAVNQTFNGHTVYGNFCVNKFSISNNEFTLLFYSKDSHGQEYLLEHCTRNFSLNCVCDCTNMTNFPYPKNKLRFNLVKVDSSASGRCCWDIVMINPSTQDSSSCEYDLSGLWALLRAPSTFQINGDLFNLYGYSGEFNFNKDRDHYNWQAPNPFIIKPGEKVTIGEICTYGILPNNYNDIPVDLIFSSSQNNVQGCDTVFTTHLTCDSVIVPVDTNCCNNWELRIEPRIIYGELSDSNSVSTNILNDFNMKIHHKNTPDFCNDNDTLLVSISISGSNYSYQGEFSLKDLFSNMINICPLMRISDTSLICVRLINKNTSDTCIKCAYVPTTLPPQVKKDNDVLLKSSSYLKDHPDEFFDVVPNPIENKFDIIFRSDNVENCTATLNDNLGNLLMSNKFTSQKGINRITFSNINFNSGMYFINLNIAGTLYSKKVLILK